MHAAGVHIRVACRVKREPAGGGLADTKYWRLWHTGQQAAAACLCSLLVKLVLSF